MRLQLNQTVWVQVVGEADSQGANCVVAGATTDRVAIRFPESKLPPSGLEAGASVMLRVTSERGVHTAVASVVQVALKPYVAITLRAPLSFKTTQNRKFFRVAVKLPVSCTIRAATDEARVGRSDDAARTHDLSAGGMRLATALPLRVGDEVALKLKVRGLRSTEQAFNLVGRVLRVGPGDKKPRETIQAGIEFLHTNQREQDALVLLMFELQRKSLT